MHIRKLRYPLYFTITALLVAIAIMAVIVPVIPASAESPEPFLSNSLHEDNPFTIRTRYPYSYISTQNDVLLHTVTTGSASSIEETTAVFNSELTDTGGENCDARDFVYDTTSRAEPGNRSPLPSGYSDNVFQYGSFEAGPFNTSPFTALQSGTRYFYRAWSGKTVEDLKQLSDEAAQAVATPPETTVTDVDPSEGNRGQTLDVTITGTYFNGATEVSFGDGIDINSFTVDSNTQITANITIDGAAALGTRDVTATSPAGTGTGTDAFSILPQTQTDTASPSEGNQGQTLDVTITGTRFTGATEVSFGDGISVNSFAVDSDTQITANITIDGAATPGARNVFVTSPAGTGTGTDAFMVLQQIRIDTATPSEGNQGQTLDVTITGTRFTGATKVNFGEGIAANNFTVDSNTQITANITIGGSAAPGARDVSVTSPAGTVTGTDVFTVLQPQQTVVTATGTGNATFALSDGSITNLTAHTQAAITCAPEDDLSFSHGLFSFTITDITPGAIVTVTITLPTAVPEGAQYWKCQNGAWVDCTSLLGDDDGDNLLTLTITDGGPGDADGQANGTIIDPGGPAVQTTGVAAAGAQSSEAPEMYMATQARLIVPMVRVQPQEVLTNQPVTIYANIANRGDMETAYTVSLKIDGIIEQSKSGNIAGNMAEPLEFQVIKSEPGTYYVEINGRKSFFTVVDNGEVARTSQTGIAGPVIFSALSIVFGTILAVFLRKCRIST